MDIRTPRNEQSLCSPQIRRSVFLCVYIYLYCTDRVTRRRAKHPPGLGTMRTGHQSLQVARPLDPARARIAGGRDRLQVQVHVTRWQAITQPSDGQPFAPVPQATGRFQAPNAPHRLDGTVSTTPQAEIWITEMGRIAITGSGQVASSTALAFQRGSASRSVTTSRIGFFR